MMTTRLVVKNLPSWISESELRDIFEQKGCLTDCSIKYNSTGKSRRFAFIGYSSAEEAQSAVEFFDKSCIGSSRVRVETCKDLADSTTIQTQTPKKSSLRNSQLPENLVNDEKFAEFMQLHQNNDKNWKNDVLDQCQSKSEKRPESRKQFTSTDDALHSSNISDDLDVPIGDFYSSMVKVKNLPFNVTKEQLRQLFCGLDINRIVFSAKKRRPGECSIAHVEFKDSAGVDHALRRNKNFLGGKKVVVTRVVRSDVVKSSKAARNNAKKQFSCTKLDRHQPADIMDSGRLFIRNLSYLCTEDDIQELFSKYGELNEVYLPLEKLTKRNKGFAFASFLLPEHAVKALNDLDGTIFQGRMLHVIPAEAKPEGETLSDELQRAGSSFKAAKDAALKQTANSSHNWNALFIGNNAVVENISSDYGAEKKDLFENAGAAVRLALGETEIVLKTRKFLEDHGVHLEAFGKAVLKRSNTIILVKNLPAKSSISDLRSMFEKFGTIVRLVLPPSGTTALIEYSDANEARIAFRSLAYRRFKNLPLYLEWAPLDSFVTDAPLLKDEPVSQIPSVTPPANFPKEETKINPDEIAVFVKNLKFSSTEADLGEIFEAKFPGKVVRATIAKNKDSHRQVMSLGFGFVEFSDASTAQEALKTMQHTELDGHKIELSISRNYKKSSSTKVKNNSTSATERQEVPSTRILVRNIPFEASSKDIQELFAVFGSLRSVRLPKKPIVQAVGNVSGRSGGGRSAQLHRGFGFVDFQSLEEAKRAFDALRHSTHVYGRRLVLEWAKTEEADLVDELRAKAAERAVAAAAAASGAVHAGAAKRLRKADFVASVEKIAKKSKENEEDIG